jgi:NADH dehydrogenase
MRVVVVGGGFGGLAAVQGLAGARVDIILVDRTNHHLFQPLLYQVATAGLAPSDIAEPLRAIVARQRNVAVRQAEVVGVDLGARLVRLADGDVLPYDRLILATGARHAYFGHPEWEAHAPGLKTLGDALHLRRRVLDAFERAEWTDDESERNALLTFAVVGAGATGVELAGALREIAFHTLRHDFRRIDPRRARVVLVEATTEVLPAMQEGSRRSACRQLVRLGVELRLGAAVVGVDESGLAFADGRRLDARTVLWAAGVAGSPLGALVGDTDRQGRVRVAPDLSVPGHPEVLVVGDLARVEDDGGTVPGVAPAATQMGDHAARVVRADLAGAVRPTFRYWDKGTMATIGRSRAVASVAGLRFGGLTAWLLWVFIHLWFLVTFRNRFVVFFKWAVAWWTYERASRLTWK